MKFSHNWLQTFFAHPLPAPLAIADALTFHSSEVEEITTVGDDTVYEVKVLPDKSAWLLSHRGLAKELSVLLEIPMSSDPLSTIAKLLPVRQTLGVEVITPACDYYGAVLISGVTIGPSPTWLKTRLEAIGQRPINNVVDATNYVMFSIGQPLHAFDVGKLGVGDAGDPYITVRNATNGETFVTLSNETCELTPHDAVITDGVTGTILGLAGVKGGRDAGVTSETKNLLIESAHFDRVAVRLTAQRHRLATDAAKRYENGISRAIAPYGLAQVAELITDIAGGSILGGMSVGEVTEDRAPVSVSLDRINRILGISLSLEQVCTIFTRLGYSFSVSEEIITVTPPLERDDLILPEDLIEEIGRIHGLVNIISIPPVKQPLREINARHFYAEMIRGTLASLGFSEVYTSSFRDKDEIHLKNALASDKSYLRSSLKDNLSEVRERNIPHRDVLGLSAIKVFEIGTVFTESGEAFHLGLTVQSGTSYKEKVDDVLLAEAVAALESGFGIALSFLHTAPGYVEFSLDALLPKLAIPTHYQPYLAPAPVVYKSFSVYPAVSRDIAMWVSNSVQVGEVTDVLQVVAGSLCVRITHLDTFVKDTQTSLAYRLVFQSYEKTLDSSIVDALMSSIYDAVTKAGWTVR